MDDHDGLLAFIREQALGAPEPVPCHWIHGANELDDIDCDEGTDLCWDCATAKVEEITAMYPKQAREWGLQVDGGWGMDHDSPPSCETCGATLDGPLTSYGVDQELEHFEVYPPQLGEVGIWAALEVVASSLSADDARWVVLGEMVMGAARAALLGVLLSREIER